MLGEVRTLQRMEIGATEREPGNDETKHLFALYVRLRREMAEIPLSEERKKIMAFVLIVIGALLIESKVGLIFIAAGVVAGVCRHEPSTH